MTRSNDLLDRVAAANPMPTEASPTPEQRHEADALLARVLNSPWQPTDQPPPRRRRTRSLALAGAVACVLVALLVTGVLDRGPSITERAYATVSEPSLYHVVTRTAIDAPAQLRKADLGLPRGGLMIESWYDLKRPASHVVQYELRGGRRSVRLEGARGPDGTTIRGLTARRRAPCRISRPAARPRSPDSNRPHSSRRPTARETSARRAWSPVAGRRAHRLIIEHDPQPVVDPKLVVRSSRTIALFDAQTTSRSSSSTRP